MGPENKGSIQTQGQNLLVPNVYGFPGTVKRGVQSNHSDWQFSQQHLLQQYYLTGFSLFSTNSLVKINTSKK